MRENTATTGDLSQPPLGALYAPYFRELAGATEGLPGQEHILEELECLRNRLAATLNHIHSADEDQLKELYSQLAKELLTTAGQLPAIRYMSRAATWLSAAAEADRKATTSKTLRHWNELSPVERDSMVRKTYVDLNPFIQYAYRNAAWLATWRRKEITAAARSASVAVRRALRRTRFLTSIRWLSRRASFIGWSLVLCGILVDSFNDFANKEVLDLLKRYFPSLGSDGLHSIERGGKIALVVATWWLVGLRLTPRLERWQAQFERRGIERFASDVMNASFKVRIYLALVHIAFFDAVSFAFPNLFHQERLTILMTLQWDVPTIEKLEGLEPLLLLLAPATAGAQCR